MAFELSLMLKKAFTDSSKYFSFGLFVAVCLCLLKTEIKQEKWLLKNDVFDYYDCDSLSIKCIIQLLSHGLELKTKN